jgi:hypothetical protein
VPPPATAGQALWQSESDVQAPHIPEPPPLLLPPPLLEMLLLPPLLPPLLPVAPVPASFAAPAPDELDPVFDPLSYPLAAAPSLYEYAGGPPSSSPDPKFPPPDEQAAKQRPPTTAPAPKECTLNRVRGRLPALRHGLHVSGLTSRMRFMDAAA